MLTSKLITFTSETLIIPVLCMSLAYNMSDIAYKPAYGWHLWHQPHHHIEPVEPFFPTVSSETPAITGGFEFEQSMSITP